MVELIVVIMIAGLLAMLAAPSLRATILATRQNSAAGLLVTDLNLARGEAIKRNKRMLVCARNTDGTNCGTNWASGWVVCIQGTTANQCEASTADTPNPLVVRPALDSSLTLAVSTATVASVAVVRFSPNSSLSSETVAGTSDGAISMAVGGSWSGATTRTVAVAQAGNIGRQ